MGSRQEQLGGNGSSTNFAQPIYPKADNFHPLTQEVLHWTGDQPFLYDLLRRLILEHSYPFPNGQEGPIVQQIVQEKIVKDWATNTAAAHLRQIAYDVLNDEKRDVILSFYLRALQGEPVLIDGSQEQENLLQTGLVKIENRKLKISNAIYASVFNVSWVEQYLPNKAKQESATNFSSLTSPSSLKENPNPISIRLWSGVAVSFLLLIVAAYFFFRKPAAETIVLTPTPVEPSDSAPLPANPDIPPPTPTEISVEVSSAAEATTTLSDKALFDRGLEHGKSGYWLSMLRDFCSVPADSSYLPLVEKQLSRWVGLFEEDIKVALETFIKEENGSCSVADGML
ncbi:MAG: hypothetical protein AAFY20_09465 [Cyanobacteria bacterium J06639_14]